MIRPPTYWDIKKICEFLNETESKYTEQLKSALKAVIRYANFPYCEGYIAIADSKIVGFVYGHVLPNWTLYPQFIYVLPEYRCKGIAKMLNSELERMSGCLQSVIYYDIKLREHYEKLGFEVSQRNKQGNAVIEVAVKSLV